MLHLLTDDIVFTGDGGGKAQAALKPVHGSEKVARGTLGGLRLFPPDMQARITEVNGQPAIIGSVDGRVYAVLLIEIAGERIRRIYLVLNPDKLSWVSGAEN